MNLEARNRPARGPARPRPGQALLLYVPITDSTAPYHSLVYLASFARAAGFPDIAIRDTNIEALNHCARTDVAAGLMDQWESRRRELGARRSLDGAQQLEYHQLVRAAALSPARVADAIAAMRDPERFYRYADYREAAQCLALWLESLSCSAWPGQFEPGGHSLRRSGWLSLSSIGDLTNDALLDRLVGPFTPYFTGVLFPEIVAEPPAVIGINITYTSQLPYALWLLRRLRKLLPDAFIVCGGTEVSGSWKYVRDRARFATLFAGADACVIGEGETAFVRLLEEVLEKREPRPIANVVRFDRRTGRQSGPPGLHYEALDDLPAPDFSLIDQRFYFSPHPLFNYSPTRGCYWNKCTFCDYGLNFGTPTSPWRQESIEKSIANLAAIGRTARHVYLSVDVLAPGRLLRLAEAMIEAGIGLSWSAEIRLERFFNEQRCRLLRESGCVAVSVGFESASERILALIDKGIAVPDVENTIRSFAEAGVAVQMMGFTGFPSETPEEAMASVAFLERTCGYWTASALGSFILTPGSILAQRYRKEQPGDLLAIKGADIDRTLSIADGDPLPDTARFELSSAKARLATAEMDRPFAGGVDSAHSIFYYSRYGRDFPRKVIAEARASARPGQAGRISPDCVILDGLGFDPGRLPALASVREMGARAMVSNRLLDHSAFVEALAGSPAAVRDQERCVAIRGDGSSLRCPEGLGRLVEWLGPGRTFAEACRFIEFDLSPDERELLALYARAMAETLAPAGPPPGHAPPGGPAGGMLEALCAAGLLRAGPGERQHADRDRALAARDLVQ